MTKDFHHGLLVEKWWNSRAPCPQAGSDEVTDMPEQSAGRSARRYAVRLVVWIGWGTLFGVAMVLWDMAGLFTVAE